MSTLDERVTDLEHRMLALEQLFDKLMIDKNPMYQFDSATSTWNNIKEDKHD